MTGHGHGHGSGGGSGGGGGVGGGAGFFTSDAPLKELRKKRPKRDRMHAEEEILEARARSSSHHHSIAMSMSSSALPWVNGVLVHASSESTTQLSPRSYGSGPSPEGQGLGPGLGLGFVSGPGLGPGAGAGQGLGFGQQGQQTLALTHLLALEALPSLLACVDIVQVC